MYVSLGIVLVLVDRRQNANIVTGKRNITQVNVNIKQKHKKLSFQPFLRFTGSEVSLSLEENSHFNH